MSVQATPVASVAAKKAQNPVDDPPATQSQQPDNAQGGRPKGVIYNNDDRLDVHQASPVWRERAKSTLTLVDTQDVRIEGDKAKLVNGDYNVCPEERFSEQQTLGWCSAWSVGDNIVITAGHCIAPGEEADVKMVAGFEVDAPGGEGPSELPASSVYDVKKVVYSVQDRQTGADYAIVLLDRPFEQGSGFAINEEDSLRKGTEVTMVGYPAGLPVKVAGGAIVRDNSPTGFFRADLDAYGGNSGSVVVNTESGVGEGILVRGAQDYVWTSDGCKISNVIDGNSRPGEEVTKTAVFADELREVRAGQTTPAEPLPGGQLDAALLRNALEPQIWKELRRVDRKFGPKQGSVEEDRAHLNQAEISALPPLYREALSQNRKLNGRGLISTSDAARAIALAVEKRFDSFLAELAKNDEPFRVDALARIPDVEVRLLITASVLAVYGAKAFQ